jgi:hypothetical protein
MPPSVGCRRLTPNLENDFQLDGGAERKACDSIHQAPRVLVLSEDVLQQSSGHIWELVQRAIRDAGFKAAPAHVAILDKGQRSVKGLNSGSESVVTVDLVLTVQKPALAERADDARDLENGDTQCLIDEVIEELSTQEALRCEC